MQDIRSRSISGSRLGGASNASRICMGEMGVAVDSLMIKDKEGFEKLIREAWNHEFTGWDFSFVSGRMVESPLSWDYRKSVAKRMQKATSLLDQDTGGGEFLASLQPLPPGACATEGYPPNVPIAKERLEPLGVKVFNTHAAMRLPFDDDSFDLVINRHGGILAAELKRILKPAGCFLTEQVGDKNCARLNEALQSKPEFSFSEWTLERAVKQLESAGLEILEKKEEFPAMDFLDIGAVVYYLKAISGQVSDFTIEKYYDQLAEIHNAIQERGKFTVEAHRFYIEAQNP
jgi:SAM-dependent methyltransferase